MNTYDYIFGKNQFKVTNKQLMNEKLEHEAQEEETHLEVKDLDKADALEDLARREANDQEDEGNN